MKNSLRIAIIVVAALGLSACHQKQEAASTQQTLITVKKSPYSTSLFYSGVITPLDTIVVTSPDEGIVRSINFDYGQVATKGQFLFEVDSDKFQEDFVTAVTKYLQAKNSFEETKSKLSSTKSLYNDGLISRDSLQSASDSYYNDAVSLLLSKKSLVDILRSHKNIKLDVDNLELSDLDRVKKILGSGDKSNLIRVNANASGIALLPDHNTVGDTSGGGSSQTVAVKKGSSVKKGQVVLSIGNLNGVVIKININEVNINSVKAGLKAIVTSVALPGMSLNGYIDAVGSQAGTNAEGGIPSFPVKIVVPTLTTAQRNLIRVGMSAKVNVIIQYPDQIQVPINAVSQTATGATVTVKEKDGTKKSVPVVTGQTTQSNVIISSGLNEGDTIVVSD